MIRHCLPVVLLLVLLAGGPCVTVRTIGSGAGCPLRRTASLYLLELTLFMYALRLMNFLRVNGS